MRLLEELPAKAQEGQPLADQSILEEVLQAVEVPEAQLALLLEVQQVALPQQVPQPLQCLGALDML